LAPFYVAGFFFWDKTNTNKMGEKLHFYFVWPQVEDGVVKTLHKEEVRAGIPHTSNMNKPHHTSLIKPMTAASLAFTTSTFFNRLPPHSPPNQTQGGGYTGASGADQMLTVR